MLWKDYCARVPDASRIEAALRARGERWTEDHVAFRALPGSPCDANGLRAFFESLGYVQKDRYRFGDKRLNAFWMSPPVEHLTPAWDAPPKVFISELDVESFPPSERAVLEQAIAVATPGMRPAPRPLDEFGQDTLGFVAAAKDALTFEPRQTGIDNSTYHHVRSFSEYGAWTLVYGACINHFTVSVHLMEGFANLQSLNLYLKETLGVALNNTGGSEIKGSPQVDLEQSATLAAPMSVAFSDGVHAVPYAFVEFAYRFRSPREADPQHWGSYFQGFVEGNADRIFSSTDLR
jgi:hypothetical protein